MKKCLVFGETDINIPDEDNFRRTPLMQAVLDVDETQVRSLLEKKANVHLKDSNRKTAIALALEFLNFQTASPLIKTLIEAKGDVNEAPNKGFTILIMRAG